MAEKYPMYQEFGTARMRANPYVAPSIEGEAEAGRWLGRHRGKELQVTHPLLSALALYDLALARAETLAPGVAGVRRDPA